MPPWISGMKEALSKQSSYALTQRCRGGLLRPLFAFLLVMTAACNKTEPDSVNGALRKLNAKDCRVVSPSSITWSPRIRPMSSPLGLEPSAAMLWVTSGDRRLLVGNRHRF